MANDNIRQRANKTSSTSSGKAKDTPSSVEDTGRVISVLDIVRVLFTVVAATLAASYYLTSGESYTYGYKVPTVAQIQKYFEKPLELTPIQLSQYDGSDQTKPIYIAINGTIFDVSASPHMYGPGGGYSVFAGRDATRAFVTGCFADDRTHDLRGAEDMFMPIEDDPTEKITPADKKARKQREREAAKQKVEAEVAKWVGFYGSSGKYAIVGKLVGQEKPTKSPPRLCAQAIKGRPKRKAMNAAAASAAAAGESV